MVKCHTLFLYIKSAKLSCPHDNAHDALYLCTSFGAGSLSRCTPTNDDIYYCVYLFR